MVESVADKTPIPTATVRQHTDPPGLWIAVFSCSIMLHISAFLLLRSLSLDSFPGEKTSTEIPIDFIEVDKTQNTQNTQKPKSDIPIKTRSQPPQTPKISPQKVQPVIPVTPQQDVIAKLTEGIAFANPRIAKKTATPIPKTKPPIKQQTERQAPPKPQVKSQLEQQFQREIDQQQRQQQLAERQRQQEISAQQRQQQLAEQQFQREIAQQQRQQQLAEKQRQQRITQQQRQQEIAEQQRQQELAEKQRQQEIAEQQRQNNAGGEKLPPPPNINKTAPGRGRIIKPGEDIATGEGKPLDGTGGFLTANLSVPGKEEQDRVLKVTLNGSYAEPLVNRQKSLRSLDGELITQPINCPAWLFINDQGTISEPQPGSPGILVLPKVI